MQVNSTEERGVALFVALFALLIVTAVAMGMMFLADTETTINANYRDDQASFYAAKAGLEEARDRMRANAGAGITVAGSLPTALPGTAGGVLYVINPANGETVAPWATSSKYFDDEICKELSCSGQAPSVTGWYVNPALNASSTYAASPTLPYKWIRISLKVNRSAYGSANVMYVNGSSSSTSASYQVCWNGTNEFASSTGCATPNKPVYVLTALSVTSSGSRRMVQYEITQDSLNLAFPAAMTFDGQGDVLFPPNSNVYWVDGHDHPGCGGPAVQGPKPAIGVPDNVDVNTIINAIPNNRRDHYIGNGAAPDVENISSTLPPNLRTVSSLEALLATIQNNATQVIQGPASGLPSYGSPSAPIITYVNGDLTLSANTTGYGILVVTGTYTASGTVGWNGIVLVVGQGNMVVSGGGNNQYNGALFLAKTRDSSGRLLSSLGGTHLDWSGGGGNGVYYSSGCINQASTLTAYRVLAFREIPL